MIFTKTTLVSVALFSTAILAHDDKPASKAPKTPFNLKRCSKYQRRDIREATQWAIKWNKEGLAATETDLTFTRLFSAGYKDVHQLQENIGKAMTDKDYGKKIEVVCRDPMIFGKKNIKDYCLSEGERQSDDKKKEKYIYVHKNKIYTCPSFWSLIDGFEKDSTDPKDVAVRKDMCALAHELRMSTSQWKAAALIYGIAKTHHVMGSLAENITPAASVVDQLAQLNKAAEADPAPAPDAAAAAKVKRSRIEARHHHGRNVDSKTLKIVSHVAKFDMLAYLEKSGFCTGVDNFFSESPAPAGCPAAADPAAAGGATPPAAPGAETPAAPGAAGAEKKDAAAPPAPGADAAKPAEGEKKANAAKPEAAAAGAAGAPAPDAAKPAEGEKKADAPAAPAAGAPAPGAPAAPAAAPAEAAAAAARRKVKRSEYEQLVKAWYEAKMLDY